MTPELQAQVDLDNINFNDQLQTVLARTSANPAQVAEAVRVNTEARLRSLKIGLLILAAVSMIAIFPASRLPNHTPGEIPPAGRGREITPSRDAVRDQARVRAAGSQHDVSEGPAAMMPECAGRSRAHHRPPARPR